MSVGCRTRQLVRQPQTVAALLFTIGVAGILVTSRISNPYTRTLPVLLAVGAVVGLGIGAPSFYRTRQVRLSPELLGSLYAFCVTAAVGAYVSAGYVRPLEVHVLTVGLYVLVAVSVFTFESASIPLLLTACTALLHRGMAYYASATQIGIDALLHNRWAAEIAAVGTLEPLAAAQSKYWFAPLYHVWTASFASTIGLSGRDAAFLAVSVLVVVVLLLAVFLLIQMAWGADVGALGALLFVMSDRAVALTVHTATTSLGVVFFALLLFTAIRYLRSDERLYGVGFFVVLTALSLTHQLSLFVTAVGLGTFIVAVMLWEFRADRRALFLLVGIAIAGAVQSSVTELQGAGSDVSLLAVVMNNVVESLMARGGTTTSVSLPESPAYQLVGSSALSVVHVLGFGLLYCLAVVGAVYWLRNASTEETSYLIGLGSAIGVMSAFAFLLPIIGVGSLLPYRWFGFIYLALAVFAAPGMMAVLSVVSGSRWRSARLLLVVVLVFAPFGMVMTWNYPGAIDGPVLDEANGAARLSTTETEAAAFEHVDTYAGGRMVVSDHFAQLYLVRYYEQLAFTYRTGLPPGVRVYEQDVLFVERAYAHTDHGNYKIRYRDETFTVRGALPPANPDASVVYSNGRDRVLYGPQPLQPRSG